MIESVDGATVDAQSAHHRHAGRLSIAVATVHSSIHDGLIKLVPTSSYEGVLSDEKRLSYPGLVHTFLQHTPDFVVHWVEIRAVRWPQKW